MLMDAANNRVNHHLAWNRDLDVARRAVADRTHPAATYAIELAPTLVAADIDLPGHDGNLAVERLSAWCQSNGVGYIVVASGQPGHAHLIARPGGQRTAFLAAITAAGITSQAREGDCLLRPPGAPHRQPGLPASTLVDPLDPALAIAILSQPPLVPDAPLKRAPRAAARAAASAKSTGPNKITALRRRGDLHQDVLELALHGRGPRRREAASHAGFDRTAALMSIACSAYWRGWSLDEYLAFVLDPSKVGCENAWANPHQGNAQRTWNRAVQKVNAWVESGAPTHQAAPREDPALDAALAEIRAAAHTYPWPWRQRPAILAALDALLLVARETNKITGIGFSIRHLSEAAGLSGSDTAYRALQALITAGFLSKVLDYASDHVEANRYALLLPAQREWAAYVGGGYVTAPTFPHRLPDPDVCHDAFTDGKRPHKGLGKRAWMLYAALTDEAQSEDALAWQTGHHAPDGAVLHEGFDALLATLTSHRLARKTRSGWIRGSASLDAVARNLGVAGAGETLKARHARERAHFHARLAGEDLPGRDEDTGPTAEDLAWLWAQDAAEEIPRECDRDLDVGTPAPADVAWLHTVLSEQDLAQDEDAEVPAEPRPTSHLVCVECGDPATWLDVDGQPRHVTCAPDSGPGGLLHAAGVFGPDDGMLAAQRLTA
jgi:hypothetical protein